MDWFPLWNSLRVAGLSAVPVFLLGIGAAYYIARLPPGLKGLLDAVLTLPLALPPTVVGYLLLLLLGPRRPLGAFLVEHGLRLVMTWQGAVLTALVASFPLMYRAARGAFESFDRSIAYSAQTLGLPDTYIFWRIRLPCCKQGIIAGAALAFVRGLGEYGATSMLAGYTPGRTAVISTTVYQMWRTGNNEGALFWALINILISMTALLALNLIERRDKAWGGR